MQALTKLINWIVRLLGYGLGVVLVAVAIAIAIFGFTTFGSRIVTEKVAEIISNRDMNIAIREPGSLLTGGLDAAQVTLSDTRGVFAEARGISINWNPLALLTGTFHAKEIGIQSLTVVRKPIRTLPSPPDTGEEGGFKLPIKIAVDSIALPQINLSEQLAGRAFTLMANGNVQADQDGGHAVLNVNRQSVPDAKLSADVAFVPGENLLRLKAQVAEPKGGLLATLLSLPGEPAVNVAIDGDGPISNWKAKLQASLDGQPRASIEGQHVLTPEGLHQLNLKGGGDLSSLLPPPFRPLFAGQTNIDVAATFDNKGKIDIQTGNLATGSVVIAASGTLDPAGNNSLNANVLGTSGPVDFRWPLEKGEARFLVSGLNLALTGDAQAARLNASASLDAVTVPQATASNVKLTAKSDAFNIAKRSGGVQIRLVAGDTAFLEPNLNRAVRGPVTLAAPLQIAPDSIGFNGTTLESANASGSVNGTYRLASQALTGNAKLVIEPAALPPAVAPRFDTPISIESQVAGTIPSKINLSNLVVKSGTIETAGNVTLDGDTLAADLNGRLPDIAKLAENTSGEVGYTVNVSGALSALAIKANLKSATLHTVDRTLSNLDVDITGIADPAAPQATIAAKGAIDGQPLTINANASSKDGTTRIPSISVEAGANKLNGNIELTPSFLPSGKLSFDFPDVSLLAALAGQRAEGDLNGGFDITNDGGKISIAAKASGSGIRRDGLSLVRPDIDVTVSDLKAFAASGVVKADEISSGANVISGLALNFTQQQNRTNFDLSSTYDANPLVAAGAVETNGGDMKIELDQLSAKPRNIAVDLAAPTAVTISGGAAKLDGLTIRTGEGSVSVSGSAGETLDINATIKDLPASLANTFVPKLEAAGTISGIVTVTGTPAAPLANFKLDWKDAATSHTKAAGLSGFAIEAGGKFADNRLDFETTASGDKKLSLKASGNYTVAGADAQALSVDAEITNVPAALANAFVPDLGAEGIISGTAKASGKLPQPTADFRVTWKDAATSQTVKAGLAKLGITANGTFAGDTLDFTVDAAGAKDLSLKATGNFIISGLQANTLSVDATVSNVPASLANGFVPDLAAEGTISGTAKAAGRLPRPAADFDLAWTDAATGQTKKAGLASFDVSAKGTFADDKLDFDASADGADSLSLKALGNFTVAGPDANTLSVDATLSNVPAGLANPFVPGLGAEGLISGTAKATGKLPTPTADFDLTWANAATEQTKKAKLASFGVTAKGKFADNRLDFDAAASGKNSLSLKALGNFTVAGPDANAISVDATVSNVPAGLANPFVPGLGAEGLISGTAKASGKLPRPTADFNLTWSDAATEQTKKAKLASFDVSAKGKFADDKLDFDATASGTNSLSLKAKGNFIVSGTDANKLDVNADISNVPAGLANPFVPGLGAEGLISGTAKASGKLPNPAADFKVTWKNAATSHTKAANITGLGVSADGTLSGNVLNFNVNASGSGALSLKGKGSFAVAGPEANSLKANADIANLPAGIANAFVPGLGAEGAISGSASAAGKLPIPNVDFKLNWKNAATSQTKSAGLAPLGITADGKLAGQTLTIDTGLSGEGGLSMKGGGSVGIAGQRALNLQFKGNLPFAILGAQLAQQGLVADGAADIDLRITGNAGGPVINGTINTSGAKLVDVRRNLALNNLTANIAMNGQQATISRFSANLASGGAISASGTVGIQPNSGYPVNIEVKLDKAVYVDGTLVVATVDGTVGMRGPLLSNPTLSGRLNLEKASITVPEKLPTSLREIDIKHIHAPAAVRAQLRDEGNQGASQKSSTIALDLQLDAPSQIFVRGRGIDSELGGSVTIKGTAAAPVVSGGFTMRRGRLTILNRRMNFTDKSRITFAGDLTPALDMEASSTSGTTTLTVDVAGLATDPAITFSSSPALPQDEVLAQLIFGQSMSKLSPVQIAQLADAVSQLAGGRSTSLFEGLRNQLGVDDLDISTDEKGQTSVSVGRYLNDRTYFELQQGGAAGAKAVINLDVGRGVKLRGAAGGNGSGEAGVVYEHEY